MLAEEAQHDRPHRFGWAAFTPLPTPALVQDEALAPAQPKSKPPDRAASLE